MRIHQALLSSAVSLSMSIGMAPPAMAQSFFQKLFGFGSTNSQPAPAARPQTLPAQRFYNRRPRQDYRPADDTGEEEIGPPDSGGPYRTICVRACDGYYFPLRHNAWRRNFGPDAKSCRNACGGEARLFYYPLNGGAVETMVDLAGRPYKEMKTAFGYRKALVKGCTCKPAPWSYEEAARHRRYEEVEAASLGQSRMQPTNAGEDPGDDAGAGKDQVAAPDVTSAAPAPPAEVETNQASGAGTSVDAAGGGTASASSESMATAEHVPSVAVPASPVSPWKHRAAAADAPVMKRRRTRSANSELKKATYQSGFGFSLFGSSKSKYVWPGDRR